jgi:hypothetical protein
MKEKILSPKKNSLIMMRTTFMLNPIDLQLCDFVFDCVFCFLMTFACDCEN